MANVYLLTPHIMQGLHTTYSHEHFNHLLRKHGPKVANRYKQKTQTEKDDLEDGPFNYSYWNRLKRAGQDKLAQQYKDKCERRIKELAKSDTKDAQDQQDSQDQEQRKPTMNVDKLQAKQKDDDQQSGQQEGKHAQKLQQDIDAQHQPKPQSTKQQDNQQDDADSVAEIVIEIDGVEMTNDQLNEFYEKTTGKTLSNRYIGGDQEQVQWKADKIAQAMKK